MNLLALETSSDACSAALESDGEVTERYAVEPRRHRELLLPFIAELMWERSLEFGRLDGIALGNGPGSFIGMRIAASVAQGLAFAGGVNLLPISSLAAVAAEAAADGARRVLVAQDARMGQAYVAEFVSGAEGDLRQAQPAALWDLAACRDWPIAAGSVVAGAAWTRHPHLRDAAFEAGAHVSAAEHPRARHLLPLAAAAFLQGAHVRAEELSPEYVREEVAKPPA